MNYSYTPNNREKRKKVDGTRFRDGFDKEKIDKARKKDKKRYYREEDQ